MKTFWKAMTVTITVAILIVGIIFGLWLFRSAGDDDFNLREIIPASSTENVKDKSQDNPQPSLKSQIVMGGASTAINKATGADVDVSKYVSENMTPEEQAIVYELTESIGVKDVANAAADYAQNGSISQSTINSITENLSEEEKAKLLELGMKYGADLL